MARLEYKDQHGEVAFIRLPVETGCTARIEWFASPSESIVQRLWGGFASLGLPELGRAGDHAVYGAAGRYLVAIVQSRPAEPSQDAQGKTWLTEERMLIHRSRREWMIVAEETTRLHVDQRPIPLMKIVKEGTEIQLGKLELTFHEIEKETLDSKALQAVRKPCPFCGDEFEKGEEIIRCPSCGTVQHAECWEDYGGRCSGPPGCRYGVKAHRTPESRDQERD